MDFEVQSPGKWILTGEHSVLRGVPALVFPLEAKRLGLRFLKSPGQRKCRVSGSYSEDICGFFWQVLERACEIAGVSVHEYEGEYELFGDLPLGSGLGASAAFCVSLGRLLNWGGHIPTEDLYPFCRELENLFHGESSGVDIAVTLYGEGIRFVRPESREVLTLKWQPQCFLSYSGHRGMTSDCVAQVKSIFDRQADLGRKIDLQMEKASELCLKALGTEQMENGLSLLVEGMNEAYECFKSWDLVDPLSQTHIAKLREAGALAVKPTGSGGGGYILSLWSNEGPPSLDGIDLIPCFSNSNPG